MVNIVFLNNVATLEVASSKKNLWRPALCVGVLLGPLGKTILVGTFDEEKHDYW